MTKVKKLLKNVLALSLCVCAIAAMSVSADTVETQVVESSAFDPNRAVIITSLDTTNGTQVLNAYTSSKAIVNTNVTTWQSDGSNTQRWNLVKRSSDDYYLIKSATNPDVALNVVNYPSNNNCNCYIYDKNEKKQIDCKIKIVKESLLGNKYGFVMIEYTTACMTKTAEYLTAGGQYGYNVRWTVAQDLPTQYWSIT